MDFSSEKTGKLAEQLTTAGVGFLAFVKAGTAKYGYPANTPLWTKYRMEDAIANIIGGNTMASIDSSYQNTKGINAFNFHPTAALNNTTFQGAGVLIADYVMREVVPPKYYKSIPIVPDVVKGAGVGLLLGGIIGGLFDPNPSGYTAINPSPVTGQIETGGIATGNVPYARAGSTASVYSRGSILA